jgi:hypothetical protein
MSIAQAAPDCPRRRGYRRMFGLMDAPYRYDVVSVIANPAMTNRVLIW